MIVDFAEQRVRQGIKDDQAIHDASMERFRPIMMTTMAALLGALRIALATARMDHRGGGGWWWSAG